jgi:alkanesulfonate monooxygenase SsuD/methylene tetrahydromethanopterin reductase-like flavin-dependent oxidoreductase (luciferase family)
VNVGVYFDLRNPPGANRSSSHVYGFTLEMCEEAERLGAHSIWVSEHHLFDDGYLPRPLTFAAAIAARTRTARIGTAILIGPLHGAPEIAEDAAVVDLISGGRLDLGLGAGYRTPEFELYRADPGTRYAVNDERVRELRAIWADGRVTPAPAQDWVPIWLGYLGPKGARRAGRLGEGLLTANAAMLAPYREGLAEGGHDPTTARMAGGIQAWITDDPEADWPVVRAHLAYQLDSYRRHMVEGTDRPVPRPIDPDRVRQQALDGALRGFLHGTPADAADAIRRFTAGAPVETVYVFASLGGMPDDLVARHIQLVCQKLGPLLADA